MRRLADRVVNLLLRLAPWYRPDEIAARDKRSDKAHREAVTARIRAEAVIADQRFRR